MSIEAGAVVILKSGGEPMTVVAIEGDNAECVWCGEEGDLFRERIPTLALQIATPESENEEEDEDEEEEQDDEEEAEKEEKTSGEEDTKRTAA